MKKREYIAYFVLAVFLFVLLNIPSGYVKRLRSNPIFSATLFAGLNFNDEQFDTMQLQIENNGLKQQIAEVREWLTNQERIESHIQKVEELGKDKTYSPFYKRRIEDLHHLLDGELFGIEAKVVFRDPSFWSSGIWVNKGERDNRRVGRNIIAKHSPVVLGHALVGVVEEVLEERCYVRLITDASLTPAVRAVRGNEQNAFLLEHATAIEEQLRLREDLELGEGIFQELQKLKGRLAETIHTSYLAKGELQGSSAPLWRSRGPMLKGVGFNYEFKDREGAPLEIHRKSREALLKVGDLLITSGLDGIFPAGLEVATISKIHPLKEGAHSYEIEAKSVIPNINELTYVQILKSNHS